MPHALGFSLNTFSPHNPGRLCRGRERWIEPWEVDGPPPELHRFVLSGATFTDDSAADALRGVPHAGVDLATAIGLLFPRKALLAFTEDGHPADLPDTAQGVEAYLAHRAGGRTEELLVRWRKPVNGAKELEALLAGENPEDRVLGFAVLSGGEDLEALEEALFTLTGFSSLDSPPARFQPAALDEVLQHVKAVVLLHRDRNGAAIGVYSREPLKLEARVEALAERAGCLLVPFAIPPMLARWDRALHEARAAWEAAGHTEPFPVPRAAVAPGWMGHRRGRRERRMQLDDELLIVEDDALIGERAAGDDDEE
jgi:hypothetical protein